MGRKGELGSDELPPFIFWAAGPTSFADSPHRPGVFEELLPFLLRPTQVLQMFGRHAFLERLKLQVSTTH